MGARDLSTTRRDFLALGASALAVPYVGSTGRLFAQAKSTLRVMGSDTDEVDIAWYKAANDGFKKAHPGVDIQYDYVSSSTVFQKLTTLIAARDVPDVFGGLGIPSISSLWAAGVLEPLDDLVDEIGRDDYKPGVLDLYTIDGRIVGVPVEQTAFALWYRKDLAEEAGVKPPVTWDDYLAFAKATTTGGRYGVIIPCNVNPATAARVFEFIRQNGGFVFDEDLKPALNSPENRETLEFVKELYQYSPPGSPSYGFPEMLSGFISGAAASTIYSGRTLQRTVSRAPAIAPHIAATQLPYRKNPFCYSDVRGSFVFKDGKSKDMAKRWIVEQRASGPGHIDWLLTAPGNNLPVRKSAQADARFNAFPLIKDNPAIFKTLYASAASGGNFYKESPNHKPNPKASVLSEGPILGTMLQRFLIDGESAHAALEWANGQLVDVMK